GFRRMVVVVAAKNQHRRFARAHKFARDVEYEIAAVHPVAELPQRGIVKLWTLRLQRLRPSVEHREEHLAIMLAESDWILQNRGTDPLRRKFDHSQAVRRSDASAHHVALLNLKMIEQRNMVARVSVPSIISANRPFRLAGIA